MVAESTQTDLSSPATADERESGYRGTMPWPTMPGMDTASIRPLTAAGLAAATPDSRDRVADFLRLASIVVVVLGHWLMAVVTWDGQGFRGASALEILPHAWLLTWVLQVMPVFFFVGGFANAVAWDSRRRRGEGYGAYLSSRLERLMRPTAAFAGAWLVAAVALTVAGFGDVIAHGAQIVAKPLWFLAVYVIVVAAAPAMLALHRRFGLRVPITLASAAVLVDIARIGFEVPVVGWLNFAFVWLIPHQLGFFYADGSLVRGGRRVAAILAAGGLAVVAILVSTGVYSPSMVGVADGRVSNNSPPSVVLIGLSMWLVGLVMLARPRLASWLRNRRVWTATITAGSMAMTVFLWHLTALMIVAPVALPLGFPQAEAGTASWWLTRPLWLALLAVATAPLALAFSRFERPASRTDMVPAGRALAAAALLVIALAGFATNGFADPLNMGAGRAPMSAAALAAGMVLARRDSGYRSG